PLVGRDVLYGCVLGVAIAWCWLMPWGFAALASAPPPPPTLGEPGAQFTAALGPHAWLGMLAANLLSPALSAISMLLILFVLRAL
uniref:hypothetical protein n=1 Tax=Klebsiella pneumoniae TaxID=573 RepID=UPI0021616F48